MSTISRIAAPLLAILLSLAGCVGTAPHHQTAKELRFPSGVIDERERDEGTGPAHHLEIVKIYPMGTNVTELDAQLIALAVEGGWEILARSNITNHTRMFDATWENPFEEFFSCQVGRSSALSDMARGVPVECRLGTRLVSIDPTATP